MTTPARLLFMAAVVCLAAGVFYWKTLGRSSEQVLASSEGEATWYDVPSDSLAAKRAPAGELTAASDTLRPGTRVRVTNKSNQRKVIVRITDDGIHQRGIAIDLCKPAAEQIGMVKKGITRVHLETLK